MRFLFRYTWVVLFFCLFGCNNKGSPAAAPTNVTAVAGDGGATITWDMAPGVQYFIFYAQGNNLAPSSCGANPTCMAVTYVTSPYVINGMTNGTTYSITIDGRYNNGPGGAGSPAVQVTPRPAGTASLWTKSSSPATGALNAVTYGSDNGTIYDSYGNLIPSQFVAAGDSGALYSSYYGVTWTALTSPLPSANFKAISTYANTYLVAGTGGVIFYSPDYATTWYQANSGTTNDINALSGLANGIFIAAGQAGTILTSDGSGVYWTHQASGTSNNLYGLSYGIGITGIGTYVAVGAAGTLLTSYDAVNWTARTSPAGAVDLRGVAYGNLISLTTGIGTPTFVAVGNNGAVITSTDGITWTKEPTLGSGTNQFTSVTFGHQFVAVDNGGNIYASADGQTWGTPYSASGPLNAVVSSTNPTTPVPLYTPGIPILSTAAPAFTYSAVGAGGLTLYSQ